MDEVKEKILAKHIADRLNIMGFKHKIVCEEMCREHRALQQEFTDLCVEWLRTCASEDYRFDDRNKFSHTLAKVAIEAINKEF